jgi:hypothetical protein
MQSTYARMWVGARNRISVVIGLLGIGADRLRQRRTKSLARRS